MINLTRNFDFHVDRVSIWGGFLPVFGPRAIKDRRASLLENKKKIHTTEEILDETTREKKA